MSRNFRFGTLLAQGVPKEEAQQKIGMVVEGAYTVFSLAIEQGVPHRHAYLGSCILYPQ